MEAKAPAEKSLFQRCREIDCSKIIHKNFKGIDYISWADMWELLHTHFPYAKVLWGYEELLFQKTELGYFVKVVVIIRGQFDTGEAQTCYLPIMGSDMKALPKPDARDISDNLMRCFVKCCALHGLGLSVYQKDDVYARAKDTGVATTDTRVPDSKNPPKEDREPPLSGGIKKGGNAISPKQAGRFYALAKHNNWVNDSIRSLLAHWDYASPEVIGWKDYEDICKTLERGPTAFLVSTVNEFEEQPPAPTDIDIPF